MSNIANKTFYSFDDPELELKDFITLMFERTDEDGVLYIPGWHYDAPGQGFSEDLHTDENDSYRCLVNWNLADYEYFIDEARAHVAIICFFAEKLGDLIDIQSTEDFKKQVNDDTFFKFWNDYLRPFSYDKFDIERLQDIEDRMDVSEYVKVIAGNLSKGAPLDDFERSFLSDYLNVSVSDDEKEYYHKSVSDLYSQAQARIGGKICAYDVIIRSRRLYRLMLLNAPYAVVFTEAKQLVAAMLLNRYGISRETVSNTRRLQIEREEQMTEEELDELYRPKKGNSQKSLLPLFVYSILKTKSDSKHHLRQKDILEELKNPPYELFIERKALSRTIQSLVEAYQFAIMSDGTGIWIDQGQSKDI